VMGAHYNTTSTKLYEYV